MKRSARGRAWKAAIAVAALAVVGAACAPVVPPSPPTPPPTSPPPPPPDTTSCSAEPIRNGDSTQYFAVVEDGDGDAPDTVTFDAASEAEKQADVAYIDATVGDVVAVEPDLPVVATDQDPNTDPDYATNKQWGVNSAGFPAAWINAGTRGSGITIAILDTGVRASHEDLAGGVVSGADEVGDGNGTADGHGHGTHVAGIAGARDNTVGGVGGAPEATILAVQVLNSSGSGSYSAIINGINDAVDAGANVISMSLGGGGYSTSLQNTINNAVNNDVIVVAAAGNNGSCTALYPAAMNGVIAVASTDQPGTALSSFSQRGPDVDIAAPGRNVWSTLNNGAYGYKHGTSMATPFVSAAAALLLACGVPPGQVESVLENATSPKLTNIQTSPPSGALRVDAAVGSC